MEVRNSSLVYLCCFLFCLFIFPKVVECQDSISCVFRPPFIVPPIKFDLTNLTRSVAPDWKGVWLNFITITFNFCANTIEKPPTPCPQTGIPGFAKYNDVCENFGNLKADNVYFSLLDANNPGYGISITYGKASCSGATSLTVHIICDPATENGKITKTEPIDQCGYQIDMSSKWGCPLPDDKGGDDEYPLGIAIGWILIIVVIGIIFLYLIIGVIVNWQVRKVEPGLELIPNWGFWKDFPFLVKDGFVYTYTKTLQGVGFVRRTVSRDHADL